MAMAMATKATWCIDKKWNAVHIFFDSMPDAGTREDMKSDGFKWQKKEKYWYAIQNPKRIKLAKKICEGFQALALETEETPVENVGAKPKKESKPKKKSKPKSETEN